MSGYQPASWQTETRGCRPGARALLDYLVSDFGASNMGCYADRPVRGGNSPSVHREGRAIDAGYDASNILERSQGDQLAAHLIANAGALGVQQIIWNRRYWRIGTGWKDYNGASPHTDHLHIELTREAGETVDSKRVAAILDPLKSSGDSGPLGFHVSTPFGDLTSSSGPAGAVAAGANAVVGAAGNVIGAAEAMGEFFLRLLDFSTWVRIGQVLGGAALAAAGVAVLAKNLAIGSITEPLATPGPAPAAGGN